MSIADYIEAETPGFPEGQEPEPAEAALPEDGRTNSLRQLKERSQRRKECAEALLGPRRTKARRGSFDADMGEP